MSICSGTTNDSAIKINYSAYLQLFVFNTASNNLDKFCSQAKTPWSPATFIINGKNRIDYTQCQANQLLAQKFFVETNFNITRIEKIIARLYPTLKIHAKLHRLLYFTLHSFQKELSIPRIEKYQLGTLYLVCPNPGVRGAEISCDRENTSPPGINFNLIRWFYCPTGSKYSISPCKNGQRIIIEYLVCH